VIRKRRSSHRPAKILVTAASTPEQHAINAYIVELRYHDLRFSLH
jgi:hypothetical protein